MRTVRINLPRTKRADQLPPLAPIGEDETTTHYVFHGFQRVALTIDPIRGEVSIGNRTFDISTFKASKHPLHRHITIDGSKPKHGMTISYCPRRDPSTAYLLGQLNLISLSPSGYILLRPLSAGVSSSVFLARHLQSQSLVCVKLTRAIDMYHLVLDREVVEKAVTVPSQDLPGHHAIHEFKASTWHGRSLYSVSEYANGLSALNVVNSGKSMEVHFRDVRTVMKDILSGLAHMHAFNVAHGNLTLDNILIHTGDECRLEKAKITGFTFAQSMKGDEYAQPVTKCTYKRSKVIVPPEGMRRYKATTEGDVWAAGMAMKALLSVAHEDLSCEENDLLFSLVSALLQPVARRRLTARAALEHPVFTKVRGGCDGQPGSSSSTVTVDACDACSDGELSDGEVCSETEGRDPVVTFRNAVKKVTTAWYTAGCWKALIEDINSTSSSTIDAPVIMAA